MSTKTKTTTKKENLEALPLPELWARFKEATGESTKSPNKKFLARRIHEALAAHRATPSLAESAAPKPPRGRFSSMTIEELQAKYLEVVGRSTGSDDRRYVELVNMWSGALAAA